MLDLAALLAAASLGLAQAPYVGVACRGPNVTTCGRIGIAVWLKRPALGVDAELVSVNVRMHAGGLGGRGPKYWQGFVHIDRRRLGLPVHWDGASPSKVLPLRLKIHYRNGTVRGAVRVMLHPGWG
jgi:hypothetical protein